MSLRRQIFEEQDVLNILFHDQHERPKDTSILLEYAFQIGKQIHDPLYKGHVEDIKDIKQFFDYLNKKLHE